MPANEFNTIGGRSPFEANPRSNENWAQDFNRVQWFRDWPNLRYDTNDEITRAFIYKILGLNLVYAPQAKAFTKLAGSIAGEPIAVRLTTNTKHYQEVTLTMQTDDVDVQVAVQKFPYLPPTLQLQRFNMSQEFADKGLATTMFNVMLNQAKGSKMGKITVNTGNQFYTFARLGFNGRLARPVDALAQSELMLVLPATVRDVLIADREWYKGNGVPFAGAFDLSEVSEDLRIFQAYMTARSDITSKAMQNVVRTNGDIDFPLTPDEETALESVWSQRLATIKIVSVVNAVRME